MSRADRGCACGWLSREGDARGHKEYSSGSTDLGGQGTFCVGAATAAVRVAAVRVEPANA